MRRETTHLRDAGRGSAALTLGRRSRPGASLVRTVLAFFFVFATLAAGHLLMVAINTLDRACSRDIYAHQGIEGRWFGDRTMLASLQILHPRLSTDTDRAITAEAIRNLAAGDTLRFDMLAVSPFLVEVTFGLILAGLGLLIVSRRFRSDAAQTVIGVFAGLLLWTGAAEYGLMLASRVLGVAKSFNCQGSRIVGVHGEYVLLKHTWGLIILVGAYLLFLETNRCPFFLWLRRRLRLMRGAVATGRIDNYTPRTAFQYITIMWLFYVLLLWAYDDGVFGVHSWFTHAVFFGSFASTGYLLLRLYRQHSLGGAIRYAIGTAIICWNTVEIAAKWGLFREPWLILSPATAVVFFGGTALGTWLVVRELRRDAHPAIPNTKSHSQGVNPLGGSRAHDPL